MRPQSDSRIESLSYWHAVQTFGAEATHGILEDPAWREKYPEIMEGVSSNDLRTKNVTLIPKEVLVAIAGREDCLYDFYADPDGIRLYCSFKGQPLALPFDTKDAIRLSLQEAFAEYGASCLFRAADLGIGRKGE
jgi:hypothetical protein